MIDKRVCDALNEQLNAELYASYLYLSISAHFEHSNMRGFAAWMKVQSQEENAHAMRLYDFINDRGGRVRLKKIDEPPSEWENPLAAFQAALDHERKVTAKIHSLVDLSTEKRDHATSTFLQWFVSEQVEEEAAAEDVVHQLTMVGDNGNGLFLLDRDLGQRPAAPAEPEQ